MAAFNDFRNRIVQFQGSSPQSANGIGALLQMARSGDEKLSEALYKASDGALKALIAQFGNFDKSAEDASAALEKAFEWMKKHKGATDQLSESTKKLMKEEIDRFQSLQKYRQGESEYFKRKVDMAEREKRMYAAQFQLQKDALQNWEKNFWGPLTGMLKGSQMTDFVKSISTALSRATGSIMKQVSGMSTGVNNMILSGMGNEIGAIMAKAAQGYTAQVARSIGEALKGIGKGFHDGRAKNFELARERIAKKQEKTVEHLDVAINKFSNLQTIMESKFTIMTDKFGHVVDKLNNYANKTSGTTGGYRPGYNPLRAEGHGINRTAMGFAQKASAFSSGVIQGGLNTLPVIGSVLGGAIGQVQLLTSEATKTLTEIAMETDKFRSEMTKSFGSAVALQSQATAKTYMKNFADTGISLQEWQESLKSIVVEYGELNSITDEQYHYQTKIGKAYGIAADENAKFFHQLANVGMGGEKNFELFRSSVTKFSMKEGVASKEIMRDISKNTNWIALVGSPKMVLNFAKSAAEIRSMGLHIDSMMKAMDGFENFENAAENTFRLNAALGTSLNPVRMHIMAMMGDVSGIQREIFKNLGAVEHLNAMQIRVISQTLGMSNEEVKTLHESLKIRQEIGNQIINVKDVYKEQNDLLKINTALNNLGYKTEQDKQEFMKTKMMELFRQHKAEFGSFAQFYQATRNSKALQNELSVNINRGEREESVTDVLKEQMSMQERNAARQIILAMDMKDALTDLNSLQEALNGMMMNFLVWGIKTITPMVTGLLNFFGLHESARVAGNTGTVIEKVLEDPRFKQYLSNGYDESVLFKGTTKAKVQKEVSQMGTKSYWDEMLENKLPNAILKGFKIGFEWLLKHPAVGIPVGLLLGLKYLPSIFSAFNFLLASGKFLGGPISGIVGRGMSHIGGNFLGQGGMSLIPKSTTGLGRIGSMLPGNLAVDGVGMLGYGAAAGMLGYDAYKLFRGNKLAPQYEQDKNKREHLGGLAGASLGAAIGTMIAPGIGTGIGAVVGRYAGVAISSFFKTSAEKQHDAYQKTNDLMESSLQPLLESRKQEVATISELIASGKELGISKGNEKEQGDILTKQLKELRNAGAISQTQFDNLNKQFIGPTGAVKSTKAFAEGEDAVNKSFDSLSKSTNKLEEQLGSYEKSKSLMDMYTNTAALLKGQMSDVPEDIRNPVKSQSHPYIKNPEYIQRKQDLDAVLLEKVALENKMVKDAKAMMGTATGTGDGSGNKLILPMQHAAGGPVFGPGGPLDDMVPALLSNGEYVIPANIVRKMGVKFFDAMIGNHGAKEYSNVNGSQVQKFKDGGGVAKKHGHHGHPLHIMNNGPASGMGDKPHVADFNMHQKSPFTRPLMHLLAYGGPKGTGSDAMASVSNRTNEKNGMDVLNGVNRNGGSAWKYEMELQRDLNDEIRSVKSALNKGAKLRFNTWSNAAVTVMISKLISDVERKGERYMDEAFTLQTITGNRGASAALMQDVLYTNSVMGKLLEQNRSDAIWGGVSAMAAPSLLRGIKGIPGVGKGINSAGETIGNSAIVKAIFGKHGEEKVIEGSVKAAEIVFDMGVNHINNKIGSGVRGLAGASSPSFAGGTMPSGTIPGFVSTNDLSGMTLHKNESVQVMNSGQRIERDNALEQLGRKIEAVESKVGSLRATADVYLEGERIGKVVVKTFYEEMRKA